ncbi:MAG: DUF305 domain-containing protein [Gemmatimonadota bacterium]|nr:DUF305 domain-containing protein [Gemmatimonadota bacterium]
MRHKTLLFAPIALLALAACGKADSRDSDSLAVAGATADTMSTMPGMSNTPARDADQEFMRMMVDHHEGMVAMADTAAKKAATADVRSDATKMRSKQKEEQQKMQGMLKAQYNDDKMPMVTPGNASMVSMLAGASGSAFDRSFREHVIMHHEEGIKMIDQFSPRLMNAELKQMATKMKTDQAREIAELRRKLQAS